MAPIPIALYAVQLDMARKVKEALLPEYDGEFPFFSYVQLCPVRSRT